MRVLATFSAIWLFGTLAVANVLQTLSLLLWPFSRYAFRRANRWIAHGWWGLCVLWAQRVHRIRPVFSGDAIPEGENAIVISNHQTMSDPIVLMMLAWPKKRLGDMKWFSKDGIKYIPLIGWGMLFLDCVFLKRDWDRDESRILALFEKFKRNEIPMWLMSFPEGTRMKPSKLALAQEFARKTGRPVPERVLIPRTRGFAASVLGLRDHIDAIYEVTLAYPGPKAPSMWQMFKTTNADYHIFVRRYPIQDFPKGQEAMGQWLMERYLEKDRRLANFAREGVLRD